MWQRIRRYSLLLLFIGLFGWQPTQPKPAQADTNGEAVADPPRILMFVAYNEIWWSECKVSYEAFLACGYAVGVVSRPTGTASSIRPRALR